MNKKGYQQYLAAFIAIILLVVFVPLISNSVRQVTCEDLKEELKAEMVNQIPLRRIGNTTDIAAMVQFLSSDEAGYITGQTYAVDGGMTMS